MSASETNIIGFPNLVELTLMQNEADFVEPNLTLVLRSMDKKDRRRLNLHFERVGDFILHPFAGFIQFTQIVITPIQSWQWERYKYKVSEVEHNTISFYCLDFTMDIEDR